MGGSESTPLWTEYRNRDRTYRTMRLDSNELVRKFLDEQVTKDDVVNVEAVMADILSHPHRKHFGTLALPSAKDEAQTEGIFAMGVPATVVYSFGHWFRMSHKLESAREKYMACKLQNPTDDQCLDEGIAMYKLYQAMAEIPFRSCPKESASMVYCVETLGKTKGDLYPGIRHFDTFNRWCEPEIKEWEQCLTKEYGVPFPPHPVRRHFFNRSARYTNLSWDKVYS